MLNRDGANKLAATSFSSNDGRTKASKLLDLVYAAKLSAEQAAAAIGAVFESAAGRAKASGLISKLFAPRKLVVGEVYDVTGDEDETTDLRIIVKMDGKYGVMWTRAKSGLVSCKSDSLEGTAKKFFDRYPHAEKVSNTAADAI
jgi:hypothetical protein